MDIRIRNAKETDKEQIFRLVEKFATSFKPDFAMFTISYNKILDNDSTIVLVIVDKDKIIGYLLEFEHYTFYANGRVGWVEEIMIDENYRRQKLGNALMDEFNKWIQSKQGKLIGLATRRAADFYKAIGYEESAVFFRKLINETK